MPIHTSDPLSNELNLELASLQSTLSRNKQWSGLADFCHFKSKGMRNQAMEKLNSFLKAASSWDKEETTAFLSTLFNFIENSTHLTLDFFPQPLRTYALSNLEDWCEQRENSAPLRWLGIAQKKEEFLLKAISVNPNDQLAREALIDLWIYNTYGGVVALTSSYPGNALQDLQKSARIKDQIALINPPTRRKYWLSKLDDHLDILEKYILWQKSNHPDFSMWLNENKK